MTAALLLDLLLTLIILLFIPIGFWRGVTKEAVVSAGILLGAAIAGAWARPWGDDLAAETELRPEAARFIVAAVALLLATFALGYGGGAALGPMPLSLVGRVLGGVVAALNGALLIAFSLGFIDGFLLEGEPDRAIDDGYVSWVLLTQFGWFLLGGAAVALLLVLVGVLVQASRRDLDLPLTPVYEPAMEANRPSVARRRSVAFPHNADAGKVEPVFREVDPFPDPFGDDFLEHPGPTPTADRPPPPRSHARRPYATNGETTGSSLADEWLRRAAAMTRPLESDDTGASRPTSRPGCTVCGARVTAADTFCPECGALV